MSNRLGAISVLFSFAIFPAAAQSDQTQREVSELRDLVAKLQSRVEELEKRSPAPAAAITTAVVPGAAVKPPAATPSAPLQPADTLAGTTVNFLIDGYYGYNFNNPIGRVNLLRAYDVSSNAISLNQAGVVLENAADPANGKRYGVGSDELFALVLVQCSAVLSHGRACQLQGQ
jgi:hypothetical protein